MARAAVAARKVPQRTGITGPPANAIIGSIRRSASFDPVGAWLKAIQDEN
jgi:hypothetical protein